MAINMVRRPSTEQNKYFVKNTDDIIPMRYAYGNQDGYVKDKGSEIGYEIIGTTFRVLSGRLVLQGVESDINANGVDIEITNDGNTNYYVVYYNVNLGTNTVSVLATYSTSGYPELPENDDLTANTSGSARLVLYRFTATGGQISSESVEKVVKRVNYSVYRLVYDSYINHDDGLKNINIPASKKILVEYHLFSSIKLVQSINGNFTEQITASYKSAIMEVSQGISYKDSPFYIEPIYFKKDYFSSSHGQDEEKLYLAVLNFNYNNKALSVNTMLFEPNGTKLEESIIENYNISAKISKVYIEN